MSQSNNSSNVWVLVFIVIAVAAFLGGLNGGGNTRSSNTATAPAGVDRGSFEHRYATERLKQEGYSKSEAQQAADAIIKFHNAQKARNQ